MMVACRWKGSFKKKKKKMKSMKRHKSREWRGTVSTSVIEVLNCKIQKKERQKKLQKGEKELRVPQENACFNFLNG